MYPYLGDFAAGSSIFVPFATYNSSGASVTLTGLAVTDIEVYKGASMTQRASDAGFALVDTDGIDLDTITGIHGFTIDTSNNTDAGFYAAGNDYTVVVSAVTVDAQTVNFIACRFSIENRVSNVTKIAGAAVSTTTAQLGVNVVQISTDATAADNLEAAYDGAGYAGGTIPQQVVLTTSGVAAVADGVLDENLTGHIAANSLGGRLQHSHSGACQAGGNSTTVVLAASASAVDDYYNGDLIIGWVTADRTNFFADYISDYVGATKTATVTGIPVSPGATYTYFVLPGGTIPGASAPSASDNAAAVWNAAIASYVTEGSFGNAVGGEITHEGTLQSAASTSSVVLDATGSSATNDFYKYQRFEIVAGTGAGQSSYVSGYTGASKTLALNPALTALPDNTSRYILRKLGLDASTPANVATAVWAATRAANATAGSMGEYVNSDVVRISGDATAADNLESFVDGTGYAGTNNVIPSVTTVTGNVNGSVGSVTGHTPQTGDTFARLGAPAGASVSADVAAVKAETAAILTDTGTTLDGAITTIGTNVSAVKTKTDSLTFTQAGHVDANVQRINDVVVLGDGSATPWGP